ncbi:MAG: CPBP family intramembrane glutamic endopeptidase [Phycisphaerales bacterium]
MPSAERDTTARQRDRSSPDGQGAGLAEYASASRSPLHVLAFLAPVILVYEIGLALHHEEIAGTGGVRAWAMLARMLETLGVSPSAVVGYSLPAAIIVVVLVLWHLLERRPWSLRPGVLALMAAETVAWMIPLLLFAGVLARLQGASEPVVEAAAVQPMVPATIESLSGVSWQGRTVIAVGAGLYEELLFRMAIFALLHALLVDLCKLNVKAVVFLGLPLQALAFALYHDVWTAAGVDLWLAGLYFAGGMYLGTIFLLRGFGLAVGVHSLYNMAVLVVLGPA